MRASGRTTRLVDKAIQSFFTFGRVLIPLTEELDLIWFKIKDGEELVGDHYMSLISNLDFCKLVSNRLTNEHHNNLFKINRKVKGLIIIEKI